MLNAVTMSGLVNSLSDLNDRQARIANQISSGQRISQLSDDAVGAGQALTMSNTMRTADAFQATANSVGSRMQAADTALGSVVSELTSAITTATAGLNGTMSDANRLAAANTLNSIRSTILSLSNTTYGGAAVFAGASSAPTPFSMNSTGTIVYHGSSSVTSVTLPNGTSIPSSVAGSSIFMASGVDVFVALQKAAAALQAGDTSNSAAIVGGLRKALDNVTSQRVLLNTAQNRLSGEADYVSQQMTNLKVQQSSLLSADTASLATELSAVTAQRSALLSTVAATQKGSLFDYL